MSKELEELKDLTRALRRRVELSDSSEWSEGGAPIKPSAPSGVAGGSATDARAAGAGVPRRAIPAQSRRSLAQIADEVQACRACPLGAQRIQAVPGVGSPEAKVMFVGEGPGFDEDHKGEPFVGRSGQLLDKIMEAIGLSRKTVYIANIVKCHPMSDPSDPEKRGNDRPPTPAEMDACRHWLEEQIRAIRPKVIVTLGASPAKALLRDMTPITKIRGQWREFDPGGGLPPVKLLPTFHPAALLRNPDLKRDVWTDMKALREELNRP